jgi:glutamine synthetase
MADLRWIRLSFSDVFGTSNSLQLPYSAWADAVANGVPFDGSALEGPARVFESDMLLKPVESTLVDLGNGLGRAVCEVLTTAQTAWPGDPRTALRLVVDEFEELSSVWTGTCELEFYLLRPDGTPADRGSYFEDVEDLGSRITRDAADLLIAHGVPVLSVHHEDGPGQYEIDLGPLPPVMLADALVLAKQVIRHSAAIGGLQVTFMPRPLEDAAGSGLHIHQHVAQLVDGSSLTPNGAAFVGGILEHAVGMCALFAPTVNSYKRLHATFEAPGAVMWSHRHRAALVRVSSQGIEFRGADPAANPYLLLAGLLLAGADGLEAGHDPGPADDESTGGFEAHVTESRYRPLPRSLDEALDALLADDVLMDGLDPLVIERLIAGRRAEAEAYRRHVTTWERTRYLTKS